MKKGDKLPEIGYFLEISDVRFKEWRTPTPCRSLREAVEEAAQHVQGMDNYLKVYRQCKDSGVYIAPFLSIPTDARPARTVIVQITSYQLLSADEISAALAHAERISRGDKAR